MDYMENEDIERLSGMWTAFIKGKDTLIESDVAMMMSMSEMVQVKIPRKGSPISKTEEMLDHLDKAQFLLSDACSLAAVETDYSYRRDANDAALSYDELVDDFLGDLD